ncbi:MULTISPECIES: type VII secretion protein EccE [unclassified Streptomyces]|uniref:type VII secretion protein EccE n=1 Tax=unclassified Streptomyces TaxID=2593676 RepID=UPI002DDBEA26|nr:MULTISPECIES: type VII secretion protein EccE [unclassified Streptomyces]WSA92039.1 type VII secretion protein EccE [Streptomyces sp. NBC_01795]WSB76405.1 type VII secretion protein EccE [Streptomyces sp. NBC_01775]WSS15320.1 type VII secretion protein EccE [Streptomyces sp. NBC_01186]WSS44164.1 type VII secretion protein EccE [Streptomyces sp. NBC_01187]
MGSATRARGAAGTARRRGPAGPGRPGAATPAARAPRPRVPASTTLRTESRTSRLGPFQLQQFVLLELAAAVLLIAAAVDRLMLVPAAVVAAVLVLLALLRRHQRSLHDWGGTLMALRARRRAAAQPLTPSMVLDDEGERVNASFLPVVECAPGLRTYAYLDKKRRTIGMLGDGTFLTAVVRIEARSSALRPAFGTRALPLGLMHDALDVDGIALESVQIVQHVQPAPAPHLPEQSVARRSYGPLQEQTGSPALRLTWVALKLDPELCPEAVEARGGGLDGAQRCLVRAADHLASRVTGAGFVSTVLNEEELISAVATSACVSPMATARASRPDAAPARRTAESTRAWRCDDRWHTTYGVGRWPELGRAATPLPRLVALLTSVPTLTTTFSLTLGRSARRTAVTVSGHVRLTGRSDNELAAARRHLERAARSARLGLVRLDREQLPGALSTLPLGGTH